ncbi:DUF305 domain-containing protein [Guyparkeria hydrothermalis]|uniref:DUF305 domain-containing protein n=1 Tax=Guyparkeria hydrothermalis TaxID=923 RepID=UPI0020226826|nr:DUF305 domain-containing protein [Guyparkeria hydrothermalis]MCL7743959.1 DUF305 domain-containing protein [Guyparkeria hydrothermalis]
MSYVRFGLMILTSTVVMFILMYLNTYAWEHLFFSETRTYMAIMMGATMAVIMLAYMLGMYSNKRLNVAIFLGAIVVFGAMLWLVRSQATVSGESYMRAMIPHHSIAVMTSERAQIRDARVEKLAREITDAQRKEIAEMRYLIADVSRGNVVDDIYRDPPAKVGTMETVLSNTLLEGMDLAQLPKSEAQQALQSVPACRFKRSPESEPILWVGEQGPAAVKLNGVIVPLEPEGQEGAFSAPGISVNVKPLGNDKDWRSDSELVFELEQGLTAGYRGFYECSEQS